MTDNNLNFRLAGMKGKGTDKHSDLIKNQIKILEAVIPVIQNVSKFGTERQINDEINKRIRNCQNILGMAGDRRSAILYYEKSINSSQSKEKNKFQVEHTIPVSIAVQRYNEGVPMRKLIFEPIALITKESDQWLDKNGLSKSGHDFDFPFRRYHKVGIEIKDLFGEVIDCYNFSIYDHYDLIKKVPQLQKVIDEI